MTAAEINAALAKADGWTGKHKWSPEHDMGMTYLSCDRCLAYKDPTPGPCPPLDYCTSYPDLVRVEAKVYGISSVMTIYSTGHYESTVELIIPGEPRTYLARNDSELHARAEVLAQVIQQQQGDR